MRRLAVMVCTLVLCAGCASGHAEPQPAKTEVLGFTGPLSGVYIRIQGPVGVVNYGANLYRTFAHKAAGRLIVVPKAQGKRRCNFAAGTVTLQFYGNNFARDFCKSTRKGIAQALAGR